jgi:dihydrofolate reductase
LVNYVTDGIESAMSQAKRAAGDANVLVHGADVAQSCLRAGVLDELEVHLIGYVADAAASARADRRAAVAGGSGGSP